MIGIEVLSGSDPTFDSIINLFCTDKDVLAELRWAFSSYKRKNPCWFQRYVGSSGATDISLIYSKCVHSWAMGWKKNWQTAFSIHISMYGKVAWIPDVFSGDLLEFINYTKAPEFEFGSVYQLLRYQEHKELKGRLQKHRNFKYLAYHEPSIEEYEPICGQAEE